MIEVENLRLELPSFVLKDINLRVNSGSYFILVGPSGSGKTVLLETIAGLHRIARGTIRIGGKDVTSLEPERRNIGMVYQDCALFPHLTVAENIAFGLKVRRKPSSLISYELDRVAELLDITHLLSRKPQNLSGGEKQKVALARALVINPKVLLLDEPLGALDPQTREGIRREIIKVHRELGITIVHVTHDFEEAISMGTHAAVIGEGSIRQVGSPDEIFRRPNSEFVARFTMSVNVFPGVARRETGVDFSRTTVFLTNEFSLKSDVDITGDCYAAIRPENILVSRCKPEDDPVHEWAKEPATVNESAAANEPAAELAQGPATANGPATVNESATQLAKEPATVNESAAELAQGPATANEPELSTEPANVYSAVISQVVNKGAIVNIHVNLPPSLTCLLTRHTFDKMGLGVGQRVYLVIPPSAVSLFLRT